MDRRLLTDLQRPVWDSVALALRARLTYAVIESAVGRLPPEYRARGGADLVRALKGRRDRLPDAAARFYSTLAREVDIYASDADDAASIERHPDGSVEVEIRTVRSESGVADGRRSFARHFDRAETREIRVFLQGGGDRAVIRGRAGRSPHVRVIGGGGDDVLIDSSDVGGRARSPTFHDNRGENRLEPGTEGTLDRREPFQITSADSALRPNAPPPRDWGLASSLVVPHAEGQANVGPVLGFGPEWIAYGFRRQPYARMAALRLLWAPLAGQGYGAEAVYGRRWTNSRGRTQVRGRATNFEAVRFHGFGNDTPARGERERYVVGQTQLLGELSLSLPLVRSGQLTLDLGPVAKWTHPDPVPGSVLSEHRPRGTDPFAQAGVVAGIQLDSRDAAPIPRRGFRAEIGKAAYVWADGAPFGSMRMEAAGYAPVPMPLRPIIAVRAGGARAFGGYPFQEAASIGGPGTVRGFVTGRFIGESAVYGGAELRAARIARAKLLIRGDVGALLLADAGRVYVGSESEGGWHSALGGGVLFTTLGQVVSLAYAHGDAHRVYLHLGVPF